MKASPATGSLDAENTAYLRTLSGANNSAPTITAYRTDLMQFVRFLADNASP